MTLHSAHFQPWEVAPGLIRAIAWGSPQANALRIDQRILDTADEVRDILGVECLINDYAIGGTRSFCGIRTPACPQYSPGSWHSITAERPCGAVDIHPQGMSADNARALIRKAVALGGLPHLGGLELGVSWCHCDVRPRRPDGSLVEFRA